MSHAAAWRCRSGPCRTVLGQVRAGVLRPSVPVASVDGRGVARVVCPACWRVRVWVPARGGEIVHVQNRATGRASAG